MLAIETKISESDVDCTSFAITERVGVKDVFGFDDPFKTRELILQPSKPK
jgi:predicted nucleic acid-binding protein